MEPQMVAPDSRSKCCAMRIMVPVSKDENSQKPVPTEWRNTLSQIVEAIKEGDFSIERDVARVRPIWRESERESD
jgi:hypothetical protein